MRLAAVQRACTGWRCRCCCETRNGHAADCAPRSAATPGTPGWRSDAAHGLLTKALPGASELERRALMQSCSSAAGPAAWKRSARPILDGTGSAGSKCDAAPAVAVALALEIAGHAAGAEVAAASGTFSLETSGAAQQRTAAFPKLLVRVAARTMKPATAHRKRLGRPTRRPREETAARMALTAPRRSSTCWCT